MSKHPHIIAAIQSELWAITPEALQQVVAIAQGFGDPEAVASKLGRPLANARKVSVRDGVAVVPVIGPIFRYANMFTEMSGATSVQTLALDFQAALDDPSINSIVLEIDSPGGQVSGISEFAAQIKAADKPVIAYVSSMSASAAYWIASAADQIIANDTSMLGSIGVVWQASIDSEDNEVKFISSQSPLKQASPTTANGRDQYQKTVDSMAEVFINTVATNRNTTREDVIANFGMGGIMIAADAIAVGMADELGSLESIIATRSGGKKSLKSNKGLNMTNITKELIASDYTDIAAAFSDEGYAAGLEVGKKLGAEAERERIKGIEAVSMPGHEALIAALKFDGNTTAADAAVQIIGAEKATRETMATRISADAPKPVPHAAPAFEENDDDSTELTGQAKYEHEWNSSAKLQQEFKTIGAYTAYRSAEEKGMINRFGAR